MESCRGALLAGPGISEGSGSPWNGGLWPGTAGCGAARGPCAVSAGPQALSGRLCRSLPLHCSIHTKYLTWGPQEPYLRQKSRREVECPTARQLLLPLDRSLQLPLLPRLSRHSYQVALYQPDQGHFCLRHPADISTHVHKTCVRVCSEQAITG